MIICRNPFKVNHTVHFVQFDRIKLFKNIHSHLSNHLWKFCCCCLHTMFCRYLNFFSLTFAKISVNLAAAILFCSKHNNVISIQGQLLSLKNYFKIQLLQIFYKLTECRFCIQYYEMSIWVGEASAINSNISSLQMDT